MNGGAVTWRPAAGACAHATLRALGGGRCALCDPQAIAQPEAPKRPELTPEQAAELRRKASAERMRRSLALFVRRSWHVLEPDTPLEWSWHHDALCAHLQAMVEDWEKKRLDPLGFVQRIRNLIINLPPGTAKSRLVMVHFVAWCWLRNPGMKILCISSNPENVNRDAELCRDLVSSLWYRVTFSIGWKIREDIDAKKKYKLTTGGERVSRALLAKFTGIRADCVSGDTLVSTEIGDVRIDRLHEMQAEDRPKVLSYNHENGRTEYRTLRASRVIRNRPVVTVCTDAGTKLRCTNEHRIWTEAGYAPASSIGGRRVSVLRRTDGAVPGEASQVHSLCAGHADVCDVREDFSAGRSRSREGYPQGSPRTVLQQALLAHAGCSDAADVCVVRQDVHDLEPGSCEDLLAEVRRRDARRVEGCEDPARHQMWVLPARAEGIEQQAGVLQQAVCGGSALLENAGHGKLPLQVSAGLHGTVREDGAADPRARRGLLPGVRRDARGSEPACTPRRLGPDEQPAREPAHALLRLSHDAPQVVSATASVDTCAASASSRESVDVYDIEVDGNHNFFAGGLLVHNCILADDLDDAHDVFGEADRKKRASKWSKSIYNRVNDKRVSIRIGVQQRVHEDDWTGQLLAEGGTWAHLSIPMTYDAAQQCACASCTRGKDGDDRVGTPIGWRDPRGAPGFAGSPIMHPDRFPLEDLADERKRLGDYVYDCQYEQRPGSLDGGMFKRAKARFYRIEGEDPACLVEGTRVRPKGCDEARPARVLTRGPKGVLLVDGKPFDAIALSVDASHGSLSEKASRSSLTVFGVLGADLYVLHDSTKLRSFTDTLDDTVAMRLAWKCTHVLVEAKANGRPVIEVLEGKIPGLISIETGSASKESRASAMLPSWDAGQVWILEGAEWIDEWVTELCVFPRGKHDDRVDSLAQCGAHFRGNAIPLSKWSQYGKAAKQMQVRPW